MVLVVASIFLFSPAYIDYQELIEAGFLSSGTRYEDRDIEDFSLDKQLNFTIGSSLLPFFSLLGNNFLASSTGLYLQIPLLGQKPFTLRC
jgi:hypothetical protein